MVQKGKLALMLPFSVLMLFQAFIFFSFHGFMFQMCNDKTNTSKHLTEEAGKYIEDFLLNIEDTDISSYDGERSETSSTIGGSAKIRDFIMHNTLAETHESLTRAASIPVETDGVLLPWLQWETSNDGPPTPSQGKIFSVVSGNKRFPDIKVIIIMSISYKHLSIHSVILKAMLQANGFAWIVIFYCSPFSFKKCFSCFWEFYHRN